MSQNRKSGPICCHGKPCGDTCISAVEECHEGQGSATCSTNSNCNCNSCGPSDVCFPQCECTNIAAGDCTTGSCGNCCWDPQCSRHGWYLQIKATQNKPINHTKRWTQHNQEMKKYDESKLCSQHENTICQLIRTWRASGNSSGVRHYELPSYRF